MSTSPTPSPRPFTTWLAPATALVAVLVWNLAAWALDLSPLEQPETSWGFAFATTIYSALVGFPLLAVTTFASGLAHARPSGARICLTVGAVACTAVAVLLVGLTVLWAISEGVSLTSDKVFLVVSVLVAAGLTVPLVRLRRTATPHDAR